MSDRIQGEQFEAYLFDDELVRIDWAPHAEIDEIDAQAACDATETVTGGRALPLLVDGRSIRSLSRQGREVFRAFQRGPVASIVGSPLSRTVGNFYVALSRPEHPVKLFGDEAEAVAWLRCER